MKEFRGKALYNPAGKAGEYGKWACNFYVGCSNECEYCYLKKGIGKATLGGNVPTLKKCFKDKDDALRILKHELLQNLPELQEHGIFFSFTTDPMLPETVDLTLGAIGLCQANNVPVKILTKCAIYFTTQYDVPPIFIQIAIDNDWNKSLIAIGFTLTGDDKLEPNASTNAERIKAMRKLHEAGFRTFASIEPIIDFIGSIRMIYSSCDCCDLYKIGLESGRKYDKEYLRSFIKLVYIIRENYKGTLQSGDEIKIYFKDSLLKVAGINRKDLPENCVTRDYNMFK